MTANKQGGPVAWSGWGCQYPGKMPRLYGDRRIAELNCDWENGDQVLHFTATPQPAEQEPDAAPAAHGPLFLSDEKILEIANNPMVTPCSPWWLKNDVKSGDVQNSAIAFARAVLKAAAPAMQGEPLGYVVPRMAARLGKGELCGISVLDQPEDGHTLPVYLTPQPAPSAPTATFQLGDHVRKTKGSQWKGRVVGTYSTSLTPEGYAVESDTEKGSVQIYPAAALETSPQPPGFIVEPDDSDEGASLWDHGYKRGWNACLEAATKTMQPTEQHPDDAAVDRFATAMKAKLNKKRQEGRGGWQSMTAEQLSALLHEHVRKGDPVDVGNLAMMLHQNGQGIEQKPAPDVAGLVEALDLALEYWRDRQQRYKNRRPKWVIAAESALAAFRKGGRDNG